MSRQARKCKATNRAGQPCGNWALNGGLVCKFHGGKTPQAVRGAQLRLAAAKAEKLLVRAGRPVGDPLSELLVLASEVVSFKDATSVLVNELEDRIRFTDNKGSEQLRSEVVVYERAVERCGKLLESIARLNIEDRLARVSERQSELLAGVIDAVLSRLGFDPKTPEVASVVVSELRKLA